jgi:hypothetical protein
MRTQLNDGVVTIRAYTPGIEQSIVEAAEESIREIGPLMQTWRKWRQSVDSSPGMLLRY